MTNTSDDSKVKPLWHQPADDPTWVKYQELWRAVRKPDRDEGDDPVAEVLDAVERVYYDVFNNGGRNLPDVTWLAVCIMSIQEYCKHHDIECPEFVWALEPIDDFVNDHYETIDCEPMDTFARKLILHLHAQEFPNE